MAGLKSRDDPTSELSTLIRGLTTDFVVGRMYESEPTLTPAQLVRTIGDRAHELLGN